MFENFYVFSEIIITMYFSNLVIWGGKFQDSVVAKGFFVQPAKTGTVSWEQLVAMFFPLNELSFESLANCVLFFKVEL